MKIFRSQPLRSRRAFTLVEIMMASAIAAIASAAMMSCFLLTSRFAGEGFTEARIVSNAAIAVEKMSRDLTSSFRNDALAAANVPFVSNNNEIAFSLPLSDGTISRRRYRFDDTENTIEYEVQVAPNDWEPVTQKTFLQDVDNFWISDPNDNEIGTEGFTSFVITVRVDMGSSGGAGEYSQGVKRYSMVGRVLPRNRRPPIP